MKKVFSLLMVIVLSLLLCACGESNTCNCDCPQCAQCEKKVQDATTADDNNVPESMEQNNGVIKFDVPIVVAEDEYLRVELVRFHEEYKLWKRSYPKSADETTEGATLEKIVTFKFYNKTDHTLSIAMSDAYLGSEGAEIFNIGGQSENITAGKSIFKDFLIQTGEKETLKSLEELYSLDGSFKACYVDDAGTVHLNGSDKLTFSIPNGMNSKNKDAASEAASLKNSSYLGKWQVTDITFADENISSSMKEDPELWENYFDGVLNAFDNVYFVLTESGDFYYHSDSKTNTGKWNVTGSNVKVAGLELGAEGDKLVSEQNGYLLYWEKVSNSQDFPEA